MELSGYNVKSPAVRRILREAQELRKATEDYYAQPLEDNMFEWHFTVRGPDGSAFEGGFYHGRILLPSEYPMKPPSIILLTPNGRFEVGKKVCLSVSGYHPESWQPSWSIRTVLMALIGFMPSEGHGAIGSLEYPSEERVILAQRSARWHCPTCGPIASVLLPNSQDAERRNVLQREAHQLSMELCFQGEHSSEPRPMTEGSSEDAERRQTVDRLSDMSRDVGNCDLSTGHGWSTSNNHTNQSGGLFWATKTLIVMVMVAVAALIYRRI